MVAVELGAAVADVELGAAVVDGELGGAEVVTTVVEVDSVLDDVSSSAKVVDELLETNGS